MAVTPGESPQTSFLSVLELDNLGVDYKKIGELASSGELTINQALDYSAAERTGKKVAADVKSLKNKLINAGVSLDAPFKSLDDVETIKMLANKWKTTDKTGKAVYSSGAWTNLKAIEKSIERSHSNANIPGNYALTGLKSRIEGTLGKSGGGIQLRRTLKLLEIPEAKITLPLITQAIAGIKDVDTRHAVAVNAILPFRPNEIASLTLEDYDPSSGKISEWTRKTKKRNALTVPEFTRAILNGQVTKLEELLSQKYYVTGSNEEVGNRKQITREEFENIKRKTPLFNTNVNKMTAAILAKGGLKDLMKPWKKDMGREIRGVSDLRKIIPTLLAKEMGMGNLVSKIMGHSDDATFGEIANNMKQMTQHHYVGSIIGKSDTSLIALRGLEYSYANALQQENLNSLAVLMNLDVPELGVTRLPDGSLELDKSKTVIEVLPEGSQLEELKDMSSRTTTKVGDVDFEMSRQLVNDNLQLSIEQSQLNTAQTKLEKLEVQNQIKNFMKDNSFSSTDSDILSDGKIKVANTPAVEYKNFADAAEKNEGFAALLKALNLKPTSLKTIAKVVMPKVLKATNVVFPPAGAAFIGTSVYQEAKAEGMGTPLALGKATAIGATEFLPVSITDVKDTVGFINKNKEYYDKQRETTKRETELSLPKNQPEYGAGETTSYDETFLTQPN